MRKQPVSQKMITFEQPLNEHTRLCMRLEALFNQLRDHLPKPIVASSKVALSTLLKILTVIERPDLKSKLTQMLTHQATTLAQLEQFQQVDTVRLKTILNQLDSLIDHLHKNRSKIGEGLRSNEFLNQIRLHLNNPGSICSYNIPAYALWLSHPSEKRIDDLGLWAAEFAQLRRIVDLSLTLTRQSATTQAAVCENGLYHQTLNPNLPCQLICVSLPVDELHYYPEISAGKHRVNIRFLKPHYRNSGRPTAVQEPVEFRLSFCRL